MRTVSINKVTCNSTIAGSGTDDVIILTQLDGGTPMRCPLYWHDSLGTRGNDTSTIPASGSDPVTKNPYSFESTAKISFWDVDGLANYVNSADPLGNLYIDSDAVDGTADYYIVGDDKSSYTINLTIGTIADPSTAAVAVQDITSVVQTLTGELKTWVDALSDKDKEETKTDTLVDILTDAVANGNFDSTIDAVQTLADEALSLIPIKAISFGVLGQAEVFVGLTGSFGCAIDLANFEATSDFDDNYSIFASLGLAEGVDAGLEASFAVGIWFMNCEDIGGTFVGAEVDVDEGAGFTAVAYAGSDDREDFLPDGEPANLDYAKVIFVGIDIGLDDGVEVDETFFMGGHIETNPVCQTDDPYDHWVRVNTIHCLEQYTSGGEDDVSFTFSVTGDDNAYRYPIWKHIKMTDDLEASDYPGSMYSEDSATFQKKLHPCGQIIKFNDGDSFTIDFYTDDGSLTWTFPALNQTNFSRVGATHTENLVSDNDTITNYEVVLELLK